ncbi:MAG: hypothetical protein KDC44_21770, partial [Phaeodactylibacter sp.]|nr:hypothetical protein [Phaeodactylibacter sp.]
MGSPQTVKKKKHIGWLLIVLLMVGGIYLHFGHLLAGLGNQQVIEAWADGFKTYMNAWYHAQYGSSLLHFEGMNYPFGEPVLQATELPGLALLLQGLQPLFPEIGTHVISIVHLLLLGAVFLSGLVLFQLFNKLGSSLLVALLGAYTLTFLSPCILRMYSHFGLAQHYVIPLLLLLLIGFQRSRRWTYSLGLCLTVVGASFLHFYFFSIGLLTIGVYFLVLLVGERSWIQRRALFVHLFGIVIIPVILFFSLLYLSDPVLDRSPSPYGFFKFRSTLAGFLINSAHPMGSVLLQRLPELPKIESESEVY